MRRRLPAGVRMYTGDDFNYAELIAGDEEGHSDALLGIFDAIAPAASAALGALARGGENEFFDILAPTVPLSRHIFQAPTRFYKTGRGVPRLPERAAGPFRHGRRAGERALAACISPSSSGWPTGRGCCAIRSWRRRGCGRCWRCTGSLMDAGRGALDQPRDGRAQWDLAAGGRRLPAARDHRDRALARPGGGDRAGARRRGWCGTNGLRVTGLCRGGFFPAPTAEERARAVRRQPAGGRRGGGAGRGLPGAWWWAGCRRGRRIIGAAREMVRGRAGGDAAACAGGGGAAGDRAVASGLCGGPVPA